MSWTATFSDARLPRATIDRLRRPSLLALTCFFLLGTLLLEHAAAAEEPLANRVLVVYAVNSPDSEAIARHYAEVRHVPAANLCPLRLRNPDAAHLPPEVYQADVKKPTADCLMKVGKSKILYILLAYLRPYRIDPGGLHNYALDSYLSDIWDVYTSQPFNPIPTFVHPYYANNMPKENLYLPFVPFAELRSRPGAPLLYAVWRLDGPTPAIARALVDKALRAEAAHGPKGQACIDETEDPLLTSYDGKQIGDWDLYGAARILIAAGFKVVEDTNGTEFGTPPSPKCPDTALYSGWYKYEHYNDAFSWNEGAIGFHLDSASMADPRGGKNWSYNALLRGITVTSGAMAEPFLMGLPRPDGVFQDLLAGSNVADAFLRNTRFLKWMIINVGDPLYTPFAGGRARKMR